MVSGVSPAVGQQYGQFKQEINFCKVISLKVLSKFDVRCWKFDLRRSRFFTAQPHGLSYKER